MEPLTAARRALEIRLRIFGTDNPATADSLLTLGRILAEQGTLTEAEDCFKRALAIREKMLPTGHPDLAELLEDYAALIRRSDGRAGYAEELAARAKQIRVSENGVVSAK